MGGVRARDGYEMDDELTGEPSESGADVEGLSALAPGDVHDVMMSATWALNLRQKRSRVAVPCVHTSVSPPTMRTKRPGRISSPLHPDSKSARLMPTATLPSAGKKVPRSCSSQTRTLALCRP